MKNRIKILITVLIIAIGVSGCEKDNPTPVNSPAPGNNSMVGLWKISYFELNGVDHTEKLNQHTFDFKTGDIVAAQGDGNKAEGKWSISQKKFSLDFGTTDPYTILNNSAWDVVSQTKDILELKGKTGTDGTAALTFRRL